VWPNGGLRGQGFAVVQRTTVAMAASTAIGGGAVCIRITVVERRSGAEEEVADAKKKTRNERESNRCGEINSGTTSVIRENQCSSV